MEDERSGLETEGFSRTSPTSSEQMLDPQASTSMEPLKLATLADTPNTHIQCIHTHTHMHLNMCVHTHTRALNHFYPTVWYNEVMESDECTVR